MAVAGGSNIGLRKNNEDSYYINEACGLLVIADGMGGHEHGQLASRIAVAQFADFVEGQCPEHFSLEQMEHLFIQANQAVYEQQKALHSGIMGTTLTVAVIDGNQLYVGHVGDSRLYLLRDHKMTQMTMDHSYYAELMRQGNTDIPKDNQQKNVLLKALGPEKNVEGQFFQATLVEGDRLLLCTDGLYNSLQEEELCQVLQRLPLNEAAESLIQLALQRGATDNITVLIYQHQ